MDETVMKFINRFTQDGKNQGVIETFTQGCCYWFAIVLYDRFYDYILGVPDCRIMYDEIINHFGCYINGIIYDITGNVTNKYNWKEWNTIVMEDELLADRIIRDCIKF